MVLNLVFLIASETLCEDSLNMISGLLCLFRNEVQFKLYNIMQLEKVLV
jgi:hypothetical protein